MWTGLYKILIFISSWDSTSSRVPSAYMLPKNEIYKKGIYISEPENNEKIKHKVLFNYSSEEKKWIWHYNSTKILCKYLDCPGCTSFFNSQKQREQSDLSYVVKSHCFQSNRIEWTCLEFFSVIFFSGIWHMFSGFVFIFSTTIQLPLEIKGKHNFTTCRMTWTAVHLIYTNQLTVALIF